MTPSLRPRREDSSPRYCLSSQTQEERLIASLLLLFSDSEKETHRLVIAPLLRPRRGDSSLRYCSFSQDQEKTHRLVIAVLPGPGEDSSPRYPSLSRTRRRLIASLYLSSLRPGRDSSPRYTSFLRPGHNEAMSPLPFSQALRDITRR